ncbi:unannotated protein [freshwater metagenome]|uniref:Unannotated protein n=1 Tax=freshwater metagenome TaxID=449393 RepID=A0A6J6BR80_9ZZZZ
MTVRTLHHDESIGLIGPARRNASGYRLYGPTDIERLYRVRALRQLGLLLEEIRRALDEPTTDLAATLAAQLAAIDGLLGTSTAMMAVMVDVPRDLRTLWRLTGADPFDPAADWNTMFESVGLILYALPRREEYWCTPINSITFATTGGDGVHFGWVTLPGRPVDDAPIVMTVPMAETTTSVIVGRDLREFLSLGCRFGYFTLDALVHDPAGTIDEIEANRVDPDRSDDERALLDLLTSEFGLAPWHDPARRMGELQVEYLKLLEIPPSPDPGSWTVPDAERPHTTVLVPPPPDEALVRSRDFFRSMRASRKVPQSRFNKVFRHDEPCGFQTWIGGPPLAVLPSSLTFHRVFAHDERIDARVVARGEPRPASSAALPVIVEVGDLRFAVDVPHTHAAATVQLPVELPMALSGPLIEPVACFPYELAFDEAERERVGPDGMPWAARSLIGLGLFEGGGSTAIVSGVIERVETVHSSLAGDITTLLVRTAGDVPIVVWCAVDGDLPASGAVYSGQVALCGTSDQLTSA